MRTGKYTGLGVKSIRATGVLMMMARSKSCLMPAWPLELAIARPPIAEVEVRCRRVSTVRWISGAMGITVTGGRNNNEGRLSTLDQVAISLLREAKQLRDERYQNCPWVCFWHAHRGRGQPGERITGVYQQFKDAMAKAACRTESPSNSESACRTIVGESSVTNEAL